MADTRPNITIPAGVWVDVYVASGITLGSALTAWNKGSWSCNLAISVAAPSVGDTRGVVLYSGPISSTTSITQGEGGLWAYSINGTHLMVQEM